MTWYLFSLGWPTFWYLLDLVGSFVADSYCSDYKKNKKVMEFKVRGRKRENNWKVSSDAA